MRGAYQSMKRQTTAPMFRKARFGLAGAVSLVSLALCAPALAGGIVDECRTPSAILGLGAPLPHTMARLRNGLPVKIVALGSSSTAGAGASDSAHNYPNQLAGELQRRFPKSRVSVLNKGVNGEKTADMLARLDRDVLVEHPDLVIWQSGSNEILSRSSPERFRLRMLDGLARLKAADIEILLMDAQYAPRILENSTYGVYNETIREIAQTEHVAFFDRFDAMRTWIESGKQPLSRFIANDHVHMNDAGYHCVGELIASAIAAQSSAAFAAR